MSWRFNIDVNIQSFYAIKFINSFLERDMKQYVRGAMRVERDAETMINSVFSNRKNDT